MNPGHPYCKAQLGRKWHLVKKDESSFLSVLAGENEYEIDCLIRTLEYDLLDEEVRPYTLAVAGKRFWIMRPRLGSVVFRGAGVGVDQDEVVELLTALEKAQSPLAVAG